MESNLPADHWRRCLKYNGRTPSLELWSVYEPQLGPTPTKPHATVTNILTCTHHEHVLTKHIYTHTHTHTHRHAHTETHIRIQNNKTHTHNTTHTHTHTSTTQSRTHHPSHVSSVIYINNNLKKHPILQVSC